MASACGGSSDVPTAPSGLAAHMMQAGVHLTWEELLRFAAGLEQTIECVLLAVAADGDLVAAELEQNDFSRARFVIEAVDSGFWEVWVNDDTIAAAVVLQG